MSRLVGFDIETSNGRGHGALEPRDEGSKIALMQFGFDDKEPVLLRPSEGMKMVYHLVEQDYTFVIHNAFFELDWLLVKYNFPIQDMKIWCTMTASMVLNAGKAKPDKASWFSATRSGKNLDHVGRWNPLLEEEDENLVRKSSGHFAHDLQTTVYRYTGHEIEKDQGNSDWAGDLTLEQKRYAGDDVRYSNEVAREQMKFSEKFGLEKVMHLEMNTIPATVDMKNTGIKINLEMWQELAKEYGATAASLEEELNKKFGMEAAQRENVVSLFGTVVPKAFKVSSSQELARFFGLEKADESVLKGVSHPLIPKLLEYKEAFKIASTYGPSYLKFIRDDGRIHSLLKQTQTATGRFSSSRPNLQNVPRDMLKAFLSADDDKYLVAIDYSSVESRILAYGAEDEAYINAVNSQDVHWETAKKIFKLSPNASRKDMFTIDGKAVTGDFLRSKAKGTSFGIPYGISATGLVNRGFAENADEAQDLIDSFLTQYPKVAKFLKQCVIAALTKSYSVNETGRRRWYDEPEGSIDDIRMIEKRYSRQAQNYPIQSLSADITKTAICGVYKYLNESGYGKLALTIHDSIVLELNKETANEAIPVIVGIMEAAGPAILPGMKTPVDVEVGHKETRVCTISGEKFSVYSHKWTGTEVVENTQSVAAKFL